MADFGAWSLLPPAIAILAAVVTRRVYQSLFLGIYVAGLMVAGRAAFSEQPAGTAFLATLAGAFMESVAWIVGGLADPDHAGVVVFTLFLGALVALMQRSGAIRAFGEAAMRYASTSRRGQTMAWLTGAVFLAIDDYFHVITAGAVFRPVTDPLRVSREKLAYIIDSTAAPMVVVRPVSTWVGYILGVVAAVYAVHGVQEEAFTTFLRGIPFNLYALLTLVFVGIVVMTRVEYGPMRSAERRAAREGKLLRDGARPLMSRELDGLDAPPGVPRRALNMVLPLLVLFVTAVTVMVATGRSPGDPFTWGATVAAFQNAEAVLALAIASVLAVLFTMTLCMGQRILRQDEAFDAVLTGFKAMVPALALLGLAWAIGSAVAPVAEGGVGLGAYIVGAVGEGLPIGALPLTAFVLAALIAFSTGTSFGTFAIMIPVTLSLAIAHPEGAWWLAPTLAATVGGAVFGDHCSPISDTTVLSSMASQCDHIDHVRTQLPYALTTAAVAAAGYAVLWWTGSVWVMWGVSLAMLAAVFAVAWSVSRRLDAREAAPT